MGVFGNVCYRWQSDKVLPRTAGRSTVAGCTRHRLPRDFMNSPRTGCSSNSFTWPPPQINQRLAAVRRLACEAADAGLLSPELSGIKRVKGVKQLGVRIGNWLKAEQGRTLVEAP